MGTYSGTVTRPSNGQKVAWTLAPGLATLGRQLDKLKITWYSIGNADHLDNVPAGGHTPWKPKAPFGMVTAIDVMKTPDSLVERAILALMKNPHYDTSWIDFINTNGSQYDFDGRRQGSSGDYHLHLETLPQRTRFTSNLFYDMFGWPAGVIHPSGTTPSPVHPVAPSTATWKAEDMLTFVKLTSRPDVYLVTAAGLQHLSPAQLKTGQNANLAKLPSNATQTDKDKVTNPFTVGTEAELATFGSKIIPTVDKVEGL